MRRLSELREKVIFAETGLKADDFTCVQNSKTWPGEDKPAIPPRAWRCPRCWRGTRNHQTRRAVLSGLEAHSLCGPEAGLSHEGAVDHSWEVAGAPKKQNQLRSLLKLDIRMNASWELGSQTLPAPARYGGCWHVRGNTSALSLPMSRWGRGCSRTVCHLTQ